MGNVPLAVQLLTYISDSCSREPFATEVAGILCFEHVARGHNPEPKPNTSGDRQVDVDTVELLSTKAGTTIEPVGMNEIDLFG